MRVNIHGLIDSAKCYEMVRELRWGGKIECPDCHAPEIVKNGLDETPPHRQRYLCRMCNRSFDDLTKTVFSGSHHPLSIWMLCLYFMGLNLSNRQIAFELEMNENTIQEMTTILRSGIVVQEPTITLEGTVECDEVYVVAGHKGHPESVKKKRRFARKRRLKSQRGRGTAAVDKPPILGMIQRGGQVVLRVLDNVKQATIEPIIKTFIKSGTLVNTDEYCIYDRLPEWGYEHKSVCHSHGEYARDEDGDGFHEVHVNTMEGFWSLLRSWLRPHRGVSQERLPEYVGFFQFVHNVRRRGNALLRSLVETLVANNPIE